MAISTIKADRRWFRRAARLFDSEPKIARELMKAYDRPNLTASFTAAQTRSLAEAMPDDPRVVEALEAVKRAERSEKERQAALHDRMDRYREEGRWP